MKTTARLTLALFIFCLSTQISFAQNVSQQRQWTLDNGVVRKVLKFTDTYGLEATAWTDLQSNHDFIAPGSRHPPCDEFSVRFDQQVLSGKAQDVRLTASQEGTLPDGTETLALSFAGRRAPVLITVHYELGKGQPAIRQYLTISNTGPVPATLRHLAVSCGVLFPGPRHNLVAYGGYGEQPRETFFTGRVDDVAGLLEDAKTGIGFAVLSEVPGYMKRMEIADGWSSSFAAMYDTDLFPFERTLAPHETFTSAAASVLLYQRGTVEDPHWRIPSYVRDRIAHDQQKTPPEWIYNTWEPWQRTINASLVKTLIAKASADGFTLFTMDDGWQQTYGENVVNKEHFPQGLGPVFAQADALGMKHGLWAPVALINSKAKVYVQHPDWACRDENGQPRLSQAAEGMGVVMCLASPYKYDVIERISDLVETNKLSYVKLDLTSVFNAYGEEPGCYEQGHEHKTHHESAENIYEALQLIATKLHQRFPDLLIDYTFELWGEKHLIDYGLLKVADLDWMSNVRDQSGNDAGPLQVRTLLYQRGMAIPVESMLIGNLQAETPPWQEHVATEMGSGPVFLGDLTKQSPAESQHYKDWIERYTKLRSTVSMTDSFFPLGSWRQPRVDRWDGFARLARSGEGMVVLFRNDSGAPSAELSIPGYPDGSFEMTDWNSGKKIAVQGDKMRTHITILFAAGEATAVFEIHRKSSTR
ncbi:MAG: alpha-galactosidase [Acidobacteriaceae bacterium]